ncbi:MAG: thioredoxin domain-containing protein [Bryobacteraceae bacterium]
MRCCLVLIAALLCLDASAESALDKATLENYVRHLFVWGPQIQVQVSEPKPSVLTGFMEMTVTGSAGGASQQETFYVSNDGRKIIRGSVFDVGESPFQSDIEKIRTEGQPGFGPEDAPVDIVIFSDFQCGYCKEGAKTLRENVAQAYPKEVRVSYKDFPLEQIHPWAKPAAIAGRCVFGQNSDAFWDYHDWVFENQDEITPENLKQKTLDFAKSKKLETTQLERCIDTREAEDEVNRSMAEARSLGVDSTPTLFVNGRRLVGNMPWPRFKQIIDHEIEHQKTRVEKCCEVSLPAPLNK